MKRNAGERAKRCPSPSPAGLEVQGKHKATAAFPGQTQQTTRFLGEELEASEYDAVCRNLSDYFDLLKKWREEARTDAKTDSQEQP